MIKYLKNLFKSNTNIPIKGQIYLYKNNEFNPFKQEQFKVEVLDIKKNCIDKYYVNYKFLPEGIFNNESMELSSFNYCYTLLK